MAVIFNGEIYNYKELRKMLVNKGHRFQTQSDGEVIVHLYEEYGRSCIPYLRGMFAFAIWDKNKRELFAARDFFGIKPFYYYHDKEKLIFASEIKSILASGEVKRELSPESFLNYLTFQYVPDPHTMFKEVYKLPPGHWMHVSPGGVKIHRYWEPSFEPEDKPLDTYISELRTALTNSVKNHLQSDVKVGCFLSSGIDSTSIAALMRKEGSVQTFSVGFAGANNECQIAGRTSAELKTLHHERVIKEEEYFSAVLQSVRYQDEPVADPSAIALYLLSQMAREHVKVVLSGEGADELFGGYKIYREPLALRPFDFIPGKLKDLLHAMITAFPVNFKGRNYLLRGFTPLEERFFGNAKIFTEEFKEGITMFGPPILSSYQNPIEITGEYYQRVAHLDKVTQMQYIDINLWLPGNILMKADKMTMAHSLELRVPFLDQEVYQVARTIPAKYRIHAGTTKYILRQAMKGLIPDHIVDRPKLGFPVPLRDRLRGPRGSFVYQTIEAAGIGDYIKMDPVKGMLDKHIRGEGDYSRKIWTLYIFAVWYNMYFHSLSEN
jgi:asparagine synthase (glutamine-hydrolysing)